MLSRLLAVAAIACFSGCAHHWCVDGGCGPRTAATACDACGGSGCGECLGNPLHYVKHQLTCGSGCGEIYWDEWISDPPACCDPCDDHGGWVGPRSCPPKTFTWRNLWGVRESHCADCATPAWTDEVVIEPGAKGAAEEAEPALDKSPPNEPQPAENGGATADQEAERPYYVR